MTQVVPRSGLIFTSELPAGVRRLPQLRYMGSKYRLLPWIHDVLQTLDFETALDPFTGSGCVAYLLKSMGREVTTSDFLNFTYELSRATIENSRIQLSAEEIAGFCTKAPDRSRFIEETFNGIFFTRPDLVFLDQVWAHLRRVRQPYKRALVISALVRACVKRQPRGVFSVSGDPEHYKDGRRDLQLSLREHFLEGVEAYNHTVFDNGQANRALHSDVFDVPDGFDLVYLDPPYVPRADDNCYIKRYHFLEGLSNYWKDAEFTPNSQVKKLKKPFTPFSYRRTAVEAFDRLFAKFAKSTIVLSYSSSGFPDLDVLLQLMGKVKRKVEVFERPHRYHFGTHAAVKRSLVTEYLIVGQ